MMNTDECRQWIFDAAEAIGMGFHLDTPASEYDPPLPPELHDYDAGVAECLEVLGVEAYEVAESCCESIFERECLARPGEWD